MTSTTKNRKRMRNLFFFFFVLSLPFGGYAQSTVHTTAQVREVTIFTNGAEIINTFQANLPRGASKLILQNVANDIDEGSIQLGGPDGVTVLSITREKGSNTETIVDPAHRRLQDSLDVVTADRELLRYRREAAQGALKILKNEGLLSGDSKVDISALGNLVDYYQEKSVELNTEIAKLNKEIAVLDRQIADFNQRIRTYVGGGTQIAIQLVNEGTGMASMNMTYRTNNASWQPYYDVRATSISSPLQFAYKARITQNTGVDWNNVKLVLSTGNPSQSGDAPLLQPNYVTFDPPYRLAQPLARQNVVQSVGARAKMADGVDEVAAAPVAGPRTTISENQLSAIFEIDMPYDILSNGQPHSVNLQSFEHPTLFKYYAVPKMDKDAFLLAEVKDYQSLNLMPGEANIFFENMYVGQSFIDPNITTDTLNLSMGRDKSISIKRERIMDQRSTQISGSTKRQTYTYEIRVRNNKSTTVNMLLKDQYPISTDRNITVNLEDDGGARVNSETGELTWTITVQPGETKTYRFQYQIRHPRDQEVYF